MNTSMTLQIASTSIRQTDGLYSLNDLHKAAGGEKKFQPALFTRLEQTQSLVDEINHSTDMQSALKTINGGKYRGSYGCKEIVYAYAMWISPKFMLQVIRAYDSLVTPKAIASDLITPQQQQQIKEAVNTKVIASKYTHHAVWRSIYNHFGVAKYQQLKASKFDEVIQFLHGTSTRAPVIKINPIPDLKHQRFLVSYNHNNEQLVQLVPHDASVMTIPDLLKAINEPNGFMLSDDVLIDFSIATAKRLHDRLGYYKQKRVTN